MRGDVGFDNFSIAMTAIRDWLLGDCGFDHASAFAEVSQLHHDVKSAVLRGDNMLLHWDHRQLRPYFGDNERMRGVVAKVTANAGHCVLAIDMQSGRAEPHACLTGLEN